MNGHESEGWAMTGDDRLQDWQEWGQRLNLFKQKPDAFNSPEKAHAEAERRIAAAQNNGATRLDLDLPHLTLVPPSVAGLNSLKSLNLIGTQVTDIRPHWIDVSAPYRN
jgi:hypothetical protein